LQSKELCRICKKRYARNDPVRYVLTRGEGFIVQIAVDRDKCCGSGQCVLTAPEVFDQSDDDGLVLLLAAEPAAEQEPAVREAAKWCPAAAISVAE
jgi:ferredoxin